MNTMQTQIQPGFVHPVYDAQGVFRQLLKAMSEPGVVAQVDDFDNQPAGLNAASYAIALALFDQDTRVYLSDSLKREQIVDSLAFHNAVDFDDSLQQADFVICNEGDRPELDCLNTGTEAYPDMSCTLMIQCDSFFKGIVYRATGPGIETSAKICCSAFNGTLLHQREKLSSRFPLGIDLILTCGREFFCIPRSTRLIADAV